MTARHALALAAALVATLVLASSAALGGTTIGPTTTLSNGVVRNLSLATLTGTVPASQTVTVGIYLTNPNQAAEDAYVKQLYNPSSANYENFLDPETFNSQFGVPAAKFQAAESWATEPGPDGLGDRDVDELLHGERNRRAGRVGLRDAAQDVHVRRPRVLREHGRAVRAGFSRCRRRRRPQQLQPLLHAACQRPDDARKRRPATSRVCPRRRTPACSARKTSRRPTTSPRRTTATASRWRSSAGALRRRFSPISAASRPSGAFRRCSSRRSTTATRPLRTRTTAGPSSGRWTRRRRPAWLRTPRPRSSTSRTTTPTPTSSPRSPAGSATASARCRQARASVSARTSATRTPCSPTASRFPAIRFSSRPSSRGARSSLLRVTPARRARRPVNTNGLATQGYPGLEWPSVSPWAVAVGGTDLTSDGNNPAKRFAETAWEFTGGGNSTGEPAGSYQAGVASTNCTFDQNGNPYVPVVGAAGPVCRSTPESPRFRATSPPATGC